MTGEPDRDLVESVVAPTETFMAGFVQIVPFWEHMQLVFRLAISPENTEVTFAAVDLFAGQRNNNNTSNGRVRYDRRKGSSRACC